MELTEAALYIKEKLQNKVDDIIVWAVDNEHRQVKFTSNKISVTTNWFDNSISLFAAKKKRIFLTSVKEFSKNGCENTIKNVLKQLKFIESNEDYYGIAEGKFKYKKIEDSYDKKVKDFNDVDCVEASINSALNEGAKRVSGTLEAGESKINLFSSGNVEAETKTSSLELSLRALRDEYATGHKTCCSRVVNKFNYADAARDAGRISKMVVNPNIGKAGKYEVIFDPLAFAVLLNGVGSSLSIFNVEAGLSFFSDKLNKKVGNNLVNVYDDGRLKNGIGSIEFDFEGVPTKRNLMIEHGILKKFFHNTSTARKYKTESTGNAGIIEPCSWNLILEEGKNKFEDLVKEIKNGLWITNVWYMRFSNYVTGDFSTIPRDGIFLIKNGEIKGSVKGIRVSDNMIRILENIKMLGRDAKQITSWEANNPVICPSVLVEDVNISKPEN